MAEEGWTENNIAKLTIKEYLKGFKDIDALILGCTHYPMYEKIIREEMPNVEIINTGTVIAKYLESITDGKGNGNPDEFYLTDTECNFLNVSNNILGKKIKIEKAEI